MNTICTVCSLDVSKVTWISDHCPTQCFDPCPWFQCESFRYPGKGAGTLVETLPTGDETWEEYLKRSAKSLQPF